MNDLPITIPSLDSIPEDSRKLYKESKGENGTQYTLDPAELVIALTAKEKALTSERKIRTDFETRYNKTTKEFEGIDKDEYQRLREKAKEWETEKEKQERESLAAKGNYEEALERTKTAHTKEISDLRADYDKKLSTLSEAVAKTEASKRDYILGDKVRRAITKAGVFAEDIDDVLLLTRNRFALNDQGEVIVKDESGNNTDMTLDSFFGENFKKSKPKFYQGTNSSGSGSPAGGNRGTKTNTNELSAIDKIAQGLAQRK